MPGELLGSLLDDWLSDHVETIQSQPKSAFVLAIAIFEQVRGQRYDMDK